MKNIIFLFIAVLFFSCVNHSEKNGNTEITDSERTQLLKEKKNRLTQSIVDTFDYSKTEWGNIKFTALVPAYPDLGSEGISIIENKINTLVSKYGITATNIGNPAFVIIPAINIISKNITSTAPTLYANKYEVIFYTANMLDGTIFSSASVLFNGVGETPLKAFINGMGSAKYNEAEFIKMLTKGKEKALKYYETNCSSIIQEAKTTADQKNFNQAILILKSIPTEVDCYKKTGDLIEKYFKLNLAENCNHLLAQMKAEFGKQSELGNYNEKAMSLYSIMPTDAPCYKEAQNIYSNYLKKLDPNAKQKWDKEEREFNMRKDKQEMDHTYAITKAELETKAAIEGQSALLNKYKKDAEYNKLPWLRKLVHLGEWDPFDATSKINSK